MGRTAVECQPEMAAVAPLAWIGAPAVPKVPQVLLLLASEISLLSDGQLARLARLLGVRVLALRLAFAFGCSVEANLPAPHRSPSTRAWFQVQGTLHLGQTFCLPLSWKRGLPLGGLSPGEGSFCCRHCGWRGLSTCQCPGLCCHQGKAATAHVSSTFSSTSACPSLVVTL